MPSHLSPRRRLLRGLLAALLLPASLRALAAAKAPTQINILTSYPDDVMARFEAAFEKNHPQYRIRFLWRMPHDALPYLEQAAQQAAGGETVDVYWATSPRTFARLKQQRLLRKLARREAALPARIGATQIADPDGYFVATEVAGYVFAYNQRKLDQLGVAAPRDWPELANPKLLDNIALPVPDEVGFAPVMFDIVLQAYGWRRGWALWSEIAALAQLVHRGASFVADLVGPGEVAIGLSIDFFVKAAIANGAAIAQRYPQHNGVNPGHIALPLAGRNGAGADAFLRFVLSAQGQALLTQRDIRKLPVSPQAYAGMDAAEFNPYAAAANGIMNYDGERGRERLNVIAAVFRQMLAAPHAELRALWQRVYRAEAAGRDAAAVRALLTQPPLDEAGADDEAVRREFGKNLEGSAPPQQELAQAWSRACAARRAQAGLMLDGMAV